MQLIDSIPGVPQLGKLVAASSGRGGSVMGKPPLTGWVKAQGLMVYSYEHNERWVHNGFLQVGQQIQMFCQPSSVASATGASLSRATQNLPAADCTMTSALLP